ncbi:MAG: hypothetical protein ACFFDN_05755 [Candidatus Hodarchaeota archaeon]
MEKIVYDELENFYNKMKNNINKKLEKNSVFLTILKTRKNNIYSYMNNSKISKNLLIDNILQKLLEEGFVQSFEGINNYVITIKGIWKYESINDIINLNKLFVHINKHKMFNLKKDIKMDVIDTEKMLLFGMISARAFSKDSSVDLKKDDFTKEKWKEVFEKSHSLLKNMKFLTKDYEKIFTGTKNVHIISSLFRHANKLPKKTKTIYRYSGNHEYYLNIFHNNIFNEDELSYLLYLIFNGDLNSLQITEIVQFCNNISNEYFIYLYDPNNYLFYMPEFDVHIQRSLIKSIKNKKMYENM